MILDNQLALVIEIGVDRTADFDFARIVHRGNVPNVARSQPGVRQLDLLTVLDLLLEDTVFITDGIAGAAHADGRHAVHIAGCQTAQTAVTQTGVGFLFENIGHFIAHILQRLGQCGQNAQIVGVVAQAAAHKKFHAQIVDLSLSVFFNLVLGFNHMLGERVAHDERACLINLFLRGICNLAAEVALQLTCNSLLQSSLCVLIL